MILWKLFSIHSVGWLLFSNLVLLVLVLGKLWKSKKSSSRFMTNPQRIGSFHEITSTEQAVLYVLIWPVLFFWKNCSWKLMLVLRFLRTAVMYFWTGSFELLRTVVLKEQPWISGYWPSLLNNDPFCEIQMCNGYLVFELCWIVVFSAFLTWAVNLAPPPLCKLIPISRLLVFRYYPQIHFKHSNTNFHV